MASNQELNINDMINELTEKIECIIEDAIEEHVESAVYSAVQNAFSEALKEGLSDFEFVLADGTIVRPKQCIKILSSDKSKLVPCYGGVRVDGSTLMVQTRISSWDNMGYYPSREKAIEALLSIKDAMDRNETFFEL